MSNFKCQLETLFQAWGCHGISVEVHDFSFAYGDVTESLKLLVDADIFVMSGIFTVDNTWRQRTRAGSEAWPLVEKLRERVQYNHLIYVGICGGAILSGNCNPYQLEPLDLFQGMVVRYDANSSANSTTVTPNLSEIQITSGCGAAVHCWQNTRKAVSFPTVKNHASWWGFAERSSVQLAEAMNAKVANPECYNDWQGNVWWFCLAGYAFSASGIFGPFRRWVSVTVLAG